MTRLTSLLTVAIAAAAIAAGCGDDEESSGSGASVSVTTSSLSAEEYAKKADELCQREREKIPTRVEAYQRRNKPAKGKPADVVYAETIQAALVPYLEEELEKLRALGAPEGDEETVEAILTAQQEAIDEVTVLKTLSNQEGALESHFSEANELMRDYGIEECTAR